MAKPKKLDLKTELLQTLALLQKEKDMSAQRISDFIGKELVDFHARTGLHLEGMTVDLVALKTYVEGKPVITHQEVTVTTIIEYVD